VSLTVLTGSMSPTYDPGKQGDANGVIDPGTRETAVKVVAAALLVYAAASLVSGAWGRRRKAEPVTP
jgi:hypothetical protein